MSEEDSREREGEEDDPRLGDDVERPSPPDLHALDRLSHATRRLAAGYEEPLLGLLYWSTFLDLYLHSHIETPAYELDVRDGLRAVDGKVLNLFDPMILASLRQLGNHPRLVVTETGREIRDRLASLTLSRWEPTKATHRRPRPALASVLLVLRGQHLWGRKADFGLPAEIRVVAQHLTGAWKGIVWREDLGKDPSIREIGTTARDAALSTLGYATARLDYKIDIDSTDGDLAGGSIGLPLALVFMGFESLARRTESRWPRRDVAFTGAVRPDGTLRAVAADTLLCKVRAAAGAGFPAIALPRDNLAAAEAELAALGTIDPEFKLPRLIPLTHLREAWNDPNLVESLAGSERPQIVRSRSRLGLLVALPLLAISAALWFWFGNPWSAERAQIEPPGDTPSVVRAYMPGLPPRSRTFTLSSPLAGGRVEARIVKFTPGESPSLVVGTWQTGETPCRLYAFDLPTGDLRWERDLSRRAPLPEATYQSNRLGVAEVTPVDLDVDGRIDLVVTIQASPTSPCCLLWLDADGHEHGFYGHRGYLFHPRTADIDGDGRPELYFHGTSNGGDDASLAQRATVVAVDAEHFAGWAAGGPFTGSELAPFDSSFARVVFPPIPEHCRLLDAPGYCARKLEISTDPPPTRIDVWVGPDDRPGLIVTLDAHFEPIGVLPEDGLLSLARRALEAGEIQSDFTSIERMEEYRRQIHVLRRPN